MSHFRSGSHEKPRLLFQAAVSVDDLKRLTDVNDVLLRYLLRLQLTLIINLLVIFSIYHFVYKNVRKQ